MRTSEFCCKWSPLHYDYGRTKETMMNIMARPYQQKMVHNPPVKPRFAGEGSFFWVVDIFHDTMLKRQASWITITLDIALLGFTTFISLGATRWEELSIIDDRDIVVYSKHYWKTFRKETSVHDSFNGRQGSGHLPSLRRSSLESGTRMKASVLANLHLFSSKQQKTLQSVPLANFETGTRTLP